MNPLYLYGLVSYFRPTFNRRLELRCGSWQFAPKSDGQDLKMNNSAYFCYAATADLVFEFRDSFKAVS